jgi:hypothetical protein
MKSQRGYEWHIRVAESRSRDNTVEVLKKMTKKYSSEIYSYVSSNVGSKSDAIKNAWLSYDADVYMYMDADLSTDLKHIPQIVEGIKEKYDLVIGSRGMEDSDVGRSMKRNFISYCYNIFARVLFSLNIKDLQCGFKAVNKRAMDEIVRQTKYMAEGFMDTEMLILARAKRFKIKQIPVVWKDYRVSKFNFAKVAVNFVGNMLKMKFDLLRGRYKI